MRVDQFVMRGGKAAAAAAAATVRALLVAWRETCRGLSER